MIRAIALAMLLTLAGCDHRAPEAIGPTATVVPAPPLATPPSASPGAAAVVVEHYFALLAAGRNADAGALRSHADQPPRSAGVALLDAKVGTPENGEGAAGSLFIDVPVAVRVRMPGGAVVERTVTVTLRRVNDVPGSSAEQRRWHIFAIAPPLP